MIKLQQPKIIECFKIYTYILSVCLFVLINQKVSAQNYKTLPYNTKQGLHNNLTKAIVEDSHGFIWIATDNGLERFNGINFELYTEELPSVFIKSFFKTKDGSLYAVTDMGVVKIISKPDKAEFITIARGSSTHTDSLLFYPKLIYQDQNKNLWITDNNSVWMLKEGKLKKYNFSEKNHTVNFQRSFEIVENRLGRLYVFSETGYTFVYDKKQDRFIEQENIPKFPSVDGARFIDDSRILIASFKGVFLLDVSKEKSEIENVLQIDACKINQLNDSVFYIASWTKGVHKFTIKKDKLEIEEISSVRDVKINNLFIDKKENLWLSSDFGVVLAQNLSFNSLSQLLDMVFVQSIDIAPDGKVYCVAGNAYSFVEKNNKIDINLVYSLPDGGILVQLAVSKIDPSILYLSTTDAKLFALKNNKVIRTIDLSPYGRVLFFLTCDTRGDLWACLDGCNGVLKITPDFEVELIDKSRGLDSRGIVLRHDSLGNVYCGGIGDSTYLFKYDYSSGRFTNESTELPFSHSKHLTVNDITFLGRQIYLGTSEGVVKKDGDSLQLLELGAYTRNSVNSIASDKNNFVWFSNSNGLVKYKPDEHYIFRENDGLNTIVGSYRCLRVDSINQVWFGTQTGLNYSSGLSEIQKTVKPVIANILVDGRSVSIKSTQLEISTHSYIKFSYYSLEMPAGDIVYKTRLVGYSNNWSGEKKENEVLIPSLSAGEYTLNVKARQHGNYNWSDITSFTFLVLPKWYQSWWAFMLYAITFLSLIALSNYLYHKRLIAQKRRLEYKVKIRTEEILSKNKELERLNTTKDKFFSIIAHDLKNPFSSILGVSEILVSDYEQLDEKNKFELIRLIHSASGNTYTLLENLLSWARSQTNAINFKPELLNLTDLIKNTAKILEAAIHAKNIQLKYSFKSDLEIMADKNMLTTVIRNLLMNAVKYSYRDESIIVEVAEDNGLVKVSIIDQGVGIAKEKINELFIITKKISEPGTEDERGTGLGLILSKEFIEKHNGAIGVESELGKGSVFWFTLPVRSDNKD